MTVIANTRDARDINLAGVNNVMDAMRGCTSVEAGEHLAAWRRPTHKPAYLTGYPKARRTARKLQAAAYIPAPIVPTKKAGRPATVYQNLAPERIAHLMAVGLDRSAMQEDDAPEVQGLPVWLDDIISGALVWNDAKGTAHKLSPFWMRKVIMLPVISTAIVMELTGLQKSTASRYVANGILACKFILNELNKQEMAELGISPIVYKGDG
ncbi:hypothetical protein [Aeromonas intestinalis]